MSIAQDIIDLLKDENYPTNEVVTDALNDFISILEDERAEMEDALLDEGDDEIVEDEE